VGKSRRIFLGSGTVPKTSGPVPETSARMTTKLLELRPCKTMAVRVLKEHDPIAEIRFCKQIRKSVHDAKIDPHLVFFFDDACFSLPGEVISQNNRYWRAENLGIFHELTLLDEKNGVWCAMSTRRDVPTVLGQDVQRVNNLFRRYTDHIRSGGRHLQHLL